MEQHTHTNTHQCYACGATRVEGDMRAFGHDEHLGVVSWVCLECEAPGAREVLVGRPVLSFSTVAAAERLARQGYGWSADHVMREALEALQRAKREEVQG